MNAEFLEKYIVISSETTGEGQEAVTTYSTPDLRKNLAPISFIGAIVETADHAEAHAVKDAVAATGTIEVVAGPFTLVYTIATGKVAVTKE